MNYKKSYNHNNIGWWKKWLRLEAMQKQDQTQEQDLMLKVTHQVQDVVNLAYGYSYFEYLFIY